MQGYQIGLFVSLFLILLVIMVSSAVLGGTLVTHNGKPFFPIGIYHYPEGLPLEPRLEELSRAGFNTVLSGLTSSIEFMDAAHEFGIGVLPTLGWNMVLDPGGEESKKAYLKEHIERLKDHPALLGYEAPDEIAWVDYESIKKPGQNLEALLKGYEYIKSLDPEHPIWMNHAPRNTVEYLKSYSEAGDVLGTDIYPVPEGLGHSDLDQSLNCVGQYTEKLDRVGEGRPIYMVLQGLAWEDLPPRGSRMSPQPDWVETRFMAYDAICHGANGIVYWGMAFTEIGDEIWDHLKRMASELRDLIPVLLNSTRKPMELDRGLELHLWEHRGYNYLFVLNTQRETLADVQLGLPGSWAGGKAEVIFEDRSLEVVDGKALDSFQPMGIHIYTDDPRPDLSVDVQNPGVLELGRVADLKVVMENRGRSGTQPVNLTMSAGGEVLYRTRVAGLDGYSSRSIEIGWIPTSSGEFILHLDADPEVTADERTRTNNGLTISLEASPAGPDLQVTSVYMADQNAVCAEVTNTGVVASPPFNVSCILGLLPLPDLASPGLLPGETSQVCWNLTDSPKGALVTRFTADSGDDVEEMLEGNNERLEILYLEDLTAVGPALHVRGLKDDNLWLIKYNASLGTLSEDEECTLVWGVDDWDYPDRFPRGSSQAQGKTYSPMVMGLDGLWYIIIPNQRADNLIFEFEDSASNTDDNGGRRWTTVRTELVLDVLEEFARVVEKGTDTGVDMSEHLSKFLHATLLFETGNYTGTLAIAEGYERAGLAYVSKLLEVALKDLESASSLGIDVAVHERSLYIAGKILEAGRYKGAEEHCISTIEGLAEEMAKVPEHPAMLLGLLALSPAGPAVRLLKRLARRRRRT